MLARAAELPTLGSPPDRGIEVTKAIQEVKRALNLRALRPADPEISGVYHRGWSR
jgi:hypothetical protein